MTTLFSFDIFDTCLTRACGEAKNTFFLLAERILGEGSDTSARNDFALIRMNAEREARRLCINDENEEITLNDIYKFCDFTSITNSSNAIIMQTELDIEKEILLPVDKIRNEINLLVNKGFSVIYISDMYLPKTFIEEILVHHGFYVNNNIYVSSEIKKTKSSGHLYNYIANKRHISKQHWLHTGDNYNVDYKIPSRMGIKARLVNNDYIPYELQGKRMMTDGTTPLSGYAFTLSRAIRLSLPDSPNNIFASTFIAPMFVPFVYKILCDSKARGINHLFFIARDGYILYQIALEMKDHFSSIDLSYLYASRQALYMAGLEHVSPEQIKKKMPHLKHKRIDGILYELHLESYDYSKLPLSGLDGFQIIDLLFQEKTFIDALKKKYNEQNDYVLRYFKQEGLSNGNCAIVDVVGSRRCQSAINTILSKNNFPKVYSYYFEVTWSRITNYESYFAANYQENVIKSPYYNRASQPLYEQFFAITNQQRTIEYQNTENKIVPMFEPDFINKDYKQKVFEANSTVCTKYARYYIKVYNNNCSITNIQVAQRIFAAFLYVPRKEFLKAIELFKCTGSGEANEVLLNKKSLLYVIFHIKEFFRWPEGQLVYSSGYLYPIIRYILKKRLQKIMRL